MIRIGKSNSGSSSVDSLLDFKEVKILFSPLIINIGANPNLESTSAFDVILKNNIVK